MGEMYRGPLRATSAVGTLATTPPPHARPQPSARTRRLAAELIALSPDELAELRKLCRDRLIPMPAGRKLPVRNDYNPVLPIRRDDRPLNVRASLRQLGLRFPAL